MRIVVMVQIIYVWEANKKGGIAALRYKIAKIGNTITWGTCRGHYLHKGYFVGDMMSLIKTFLMDIC